MATVPFPIWEKLGLTLRLAPGKERINGDPEQFVHVLSRDSEEKILQRLQAVYPGSRWRMTTSAGSFGFVQGARRIFIGSDFDYDPRAVNILVGNTATNAEQEYAKESLFSHLYMVCKGVNCDTIMEILTTAANQMLHKEPAKQLKTLQLAFGKRERGKLLGSPNLGTGKHEGILSLPANTHRAIGSYLNKAAVATVATAGPRNRTRSNYQGKMNELRRLYMGEPAQRINR